MTGGPTVGPLADRVRDLVRFTVAHETDLTTTSTLAEAAEALAHALEEVAASTGGHVHGPHAHPVTGSANAFAAPLVDDVEFATDTGGGRVVASGAYTVTHEGPPGCVHGGAIAAGMEHILYRAEDRAGLDVGPRTIRIHYRRPTLLGVPLRFEADPPIVGPPVDGGAVSGSTVAARLVQAGQTTCEAVSARPPDPPHRDEDVR